ncbi:hypothetical protein EMIHUDRAFT_108430 [Emiliania huxleyi CCMP1516]|uniref:Uncharacterized protein n=2 Tax=Emiliania huxleyi TaxID=2903 RepID=A0A0D3KYD3_EMIH1|nr:hypothetical protein EMIHUDRAFT_108430 [Emiliania huxleyi CCMP1516]EOD40768.1 hypothetical protein EMIHUDRAFT_108430 [Emiliania huxleyi CCMP1516]|eukprot:XP_005793197.1 hypothetical protein EMIHUDRAFT_108430 [Emiliania huxleyi CCMP1516]
MAGPPASRSELLRRRRDETIADLQQSHDAHLASKPQFVPCDDGRDRCDSAAGQRYQSRTHMLAFRAADATQASVCAAGGDATSSYHPSVAGHLPPRRDDAGYALMVTSLSRPDAKDPTLAWVEDPLVASRSELVAKRRAEAARDLVASAEQPHRPGADQRRRQRIEEAVAYLQRAPQGRSRREMMADRRRRCVEESQATVAASSLAREERALYARQARPFWELQREAEAEGGRGEEYGGVPSSGVSSHEELRARRMWWAKPEVYSAIGRPPLAADPFKIDQEGPERAAGSGRKAARPPDEKLTSAPAPPLEPRPKQVKVGKETKPTTLKRFTDAILIFREPAEEQEGGSRREGIEFTAPLYSSFQRDGVFREPRLPKHIHSKAEREARAEAAAAAAAATAERSGASGPAGGDEQLGELTRTWAGSTGGSTIAEAMRASGSQGLSATLSSRLATPIVPVPHAQRMATLLSSSEPATSRTVRSGGFGSSSLRPRPQSSRS